MNIWCVGRNFAEHAHELGNVVPSEPLIFLKAGSCRSTGPRICWSRAAIDVHHELELALQFGEDLQFHQMALALDLTERTVQNRLKEKGQPWTLAKSFRGACPLSPSRNFEEPKDLHLRLLVNGNLRQAGSLNDLIFSPAVLRDFLLKNFPVEPGDWLLTGTPKGVGPLRNGDKLVAFLEKNDSPPLLRMDWEVILDSAP